MLQALLLESKNSIFLLPVKLINTTYFEDKKSIKPPFSEKLYYSLLFWKEIFHKACARGLINFLQLEMIKYN